MNCRFKTMRFQGLLLSASVWQIYGSAALPALYSSEVMDNPEPSPEDLVIAYCQIADLHVSQGNYSTAFKLLADSKEKFIGIRRVAFQWAVCLEKILYQKCFERDEFSNIDALETQLRGSCQDEEIMHADFDYHRALYLEKIGRSDEATDMFHSLIHRSSKLGSQNQMLVANYLLKIAEILIEAENPTSALPYVLSSLCISERFHYQSSYFMAIIRLAQILIHFDLVNRAKAMIENIMPVILAEHPLHMQSIAHLIYAQCMIARITQDMKAQQKQSIPWKDVLVPLKIAQRGFTRLESVSQLLSVIQLKSYIYNAMGDIAQRDFEAREFRNLYHMQEANKRKQPDWDILYCARYIQVQKEQLSPSKQDSESWRGGTPESEHEDSSPSTDTDTIQTIPMDTAMAGTSVVLDIPMVSADTSMASAITMDTDDISEDVAFEEYLNFP